MAFNNNSCGLLTSPDEHFSLSQEEYLKYSKILCLNRSCSRYFRKANIDEVESIARQVCRKGSYSCSTDLVKGWYGEPGYLEKVKLVYAIDCEMMSVKACDKLAQGVLDFLKLHSEFALWLKKSNIHKLPHEIRVWLRSVKERENQP